MGHWASSQFRLACITRRPTVLYQYKTLKSMISKFVHEDDHNWDKWLDHLLLQ